MASGELLKMLQKSARSGTLLSSCEPEVKELMHQLDVLISQHQKEWAEQMKKTKLQLQLREQELSTLRISLHERTNQLERVRLQSHEAEQEQRTRQADCEAQLVRVRSELARLRHSYEQLRAKRSSHQHQSKGAVGSYSGRETSYRQECQSLRDQVKEMKEREKEMERQSEALRELIKKRDKDGEGLEVEKSQCQQNLAYLQETLRAKEGLIKRLEEELGLARMSAGCHGELQQVQQELKAKKQLELELRESLQRAKEEGRAWRDEVTRMKAQLDKEESEVIQKLEERVQKLERQLRESQARITVGSQNTAIQHFEEKTEAFLQTPFIREDGEGYVALEPVHGHQTDGSQLEESNKWSQMLEDVLGKHFDQLDCSLTKILSPK